MNRDYTYCIGACEPLCKKCKRHYPPSVPSHPDQIWWMAVNIITGCADYHEHALRDIIDLIDEEL